MTIGELGTVNREWIKKGSSGSQTTGLQTQVLMQERIEYVLFYNNAVLHVIFL